MQHTVIFTPWPFGIVYPQASGLPIIPPSTSQSFVPFPLCLFLSSSSSFPFFIPPPHKSTVVALETSPNCFATKEQGSFLSQEVVPLHHHALWPCSIETPNWTRALPWITGCHDSRMDLHSPEQQWEGKKNQFDLDKHNKRSMIFFFNDF